MTDSTRQDQSDSPKQISYESSLHQAQQVLLSLHSLESSVSMAAGWCVDAFRGGHKVIACGNGGSASEAQHLVGELMGRYKFDRPPLPAIAMTADSVLLTCIGNDYSFEDIFARQLKGLGQPGDVLLAFTSSGNSPNVLRALEAAPGLQIKSIAFLGRDGGRALSMADCSLLVSHADTARVQEGHNFLMHCLMDLIETEMGYE